MTAERRGARCLVIAALVAGCWVSTGMPPAWGQNTRQGQQPLSPREAALIDVTGYWVSVVDEDWRWRMLTPPKGDFASVPLTAAGQEVTEAWDPEKDVANGEECRAYGPPGGIRMPGRIHIGWQDDDTLRMEFDAGEQTRTLHFAHAPAADMESSRQGYSLAQWWQQQQTRSFSPPRALRGPGEGGQLIVRTDHLLPGYLRRNGVPYSADAKITEFFNVLTFPDGNKWLIVTTVVDDPQYLTTRFIISTNFRKEPDGSGWDPRPCRAT